MKKFGVVVEEKLRRVVTEEAETIEEAIENVENKYEESEIVLDYEDLAYQEIRPNGELTKEHTFYTYYGKSSLIEGNNELALIKTMDRYMKDYEYVVAKNIKYNSESDMFNWEEEKHFKNIINAIEYFNTQQENKIEKDYIKINNDIPSSIKLKIYDLMVDEIFELNNYTEAIHKLKDYGLSNEEICCITSMQQEELDNFLDDYDEQEEI